MERDLIKTPIYSEVEGFFRSSLEPAFGRFSQASELDPPPDGRLVAFTGSKLEKLEGRPMTRIGLLDVERRSFREITGGPNSDRLPKWSPDGRTLALLSDRAEEHRFQLYLLQHEGVGEATATAEIEGTAEYIEWSPDGRFILVGAAGKGAALAGVQGSGTTTGEDEKDIPEWAPEVESSADSEGWRRAWIYDPATGEVASASREGLNVWEATWCGPGRLAAIVSESPGEDAWYEAVLAIIDISTGQEQILHRSVFQLGLPAASRDGKSIAVLEAICSDRMVIAGDVRLVYPESGDTQVLDTGGVDVTHIRWSGNGRLSYIGIRVTDTVAGIHDPVSGKTEEVWVTPETTGDLYPVHAPIGEEGFVVVLHSYERYPAIALVREGEVDVLASFEHQGSRFVSRVGGTMQRWTWQAPDGLEIEGFLILPEGGGPHPLIVRVHGGPIGADLNHWAMRGLLTPLLVSRGFAVLHPNPRGSTGRGQAFASMVYGDMGGGDASDILAGIDSLVDRGIADPNRIGVTGGSYGGFMSAWLVTQTDRFAAAVAMSPVTDWYSQHLTSNIGFWDGLILKDDLERGGGEYFTRSPIAFASGVKTPTLLTAGKADDCTPPGQATEFYRALKEHGVESELAIYPGEGHGVRKLPAQIDWFTRTVSWFERFMPPR